MPGEVRSPLEEQQPLRAAQLHFHSHQPLLQQLPAGSGPLEEQQAPGFHLQGNTGRLERDSGEDGAKNQPEKQQQLAAVIAPAGASGWGEALGPLSPG